MKLYYLYIPLPIVALAGFPFIAAISELLGLSSTPLSVAMRMLNLILSGLILILTFAGKVRFKSGRFWIPFIVFWCLYLLRICVDTTTEGNYLSRSPFEYWVWALGACLIPALAILSVKDTSFLKYSFGWSFVFVFISSLIAVSLGSGSYVTGGGVVLDINRLNITALNPISAGHLGLSLCVLSSWDFIQRPKSSSKLMNFIDGTGFTLGLYLLFASASRGPLVALIGLLALYLISQNVTRIIKLIPLLTILLFIAYQGLTFLESQGQFLIATRILNSFGGEDQSIVGRQLAYEGAIKQSLQSPLLGDYLEERTTGFYPHNVVLESFMATGIFGGLAFLTLIVYGIYVSFVLLKLRNIHGWIPLIFCQYLIAGQFSGAIYLSSTMWAFLALIIILHVDCRGARV